MRLDDLRVQYLSFHARFCRRASPVSSDFNAERPCRTLLWLVWLSNTKKHYSVVLHFAGGSSAVTGIVLQL